MGVAVGRGVLVGAGVGIAVGGAVGEGSVVAVGEEGAVGVGSDVAVGLGVCVGVGTGVNVGVRVGEVQARSNTTLMTTATSSMARVSRSQRFTSLEEVLSTTSMAYPLALPLRIV